jgi:cytochrome c oxidase subunit II
MGRLTGLLAVVMVLGLPWKAHAGDASKPGATAAPAPSTPPPAAAPPSKAAPASAAPKAERVIHVEARKFSFNPARIEVKKGESVVLELVSLDRDHGFSAPELDIRADIKPGAPTRVPFTATKTGTFSFHCDVFCGSGHEGMEGDIVVTE